MRHEPPLAYLLTFTTYGTWLPGDPRGSVDRTRNGWGEPRQAPNDARQARARHCLANRPVFFGREERVLCTRVIEEVCRHRSWLPSAINVRTNHVHVVVAAPQAPERVLNDFKAWCTRRLREAALARPGDAVWSEGGSKRYLFTTSAVAAAREYVIERQGTVQGVGVPWVECQ